MFNPESTFSFNPPNNFEFNSNTSFQERLKQFEDKKKSVPKPAEYEMVDSTVQHSLKQNATAFQKQQPNMMNFQPPSFNPIGNYNMGAMA